MLGRVIENYDSDMMIFNTTFVNNSAARYCFSYNCCFTGGIVYSNSSHISTLKILDSKFVQNIGTTIFTFQVNTSISNCKFINNSAPFVTVFANESNLITPYKTNIKNAGQILLARDTNMSITHSVFTNNVASSMMVVNGRGIISIDHSKFTSNSGRILHSRDSKTVSITHSEFVDNSVAANSLLIIYGDLVTVSYSEFIDNTVATGSLIYLNGDIRTLTIHLNNFVNNKVFNGII